MIQKKEHQTRRQQSWALRPDGQIFSKSLALSAPQMPHLWSHSIFQHPRKESSIHGQRINTCCAPADLNNATAFGCYPPWSSFVGQGPTLLFHLNRLCLQQLQNTLGSAHAALTLRLPLFLLLVLDKRVVAMAKNRKKGGQLVATDHRERQVSG